MTNHKSTSSIQRVVDKEYDRYHTMDIETFRSNKSNGAPAPGQAQAPDKIRVFPIDPSVDAALLREAAGATKTPEEHRKNYKATLHNTNPAWKGPAVKYPPVPIKQEKSNKVKEVFKKLGCFGKAE